MFKKNDVVQITDESHPWYPALLIVDKVKDWDIQAYCLIPNSNIQHDVGLAYNRFYDNQVEKIGHSVIVNKGE